MLFNLATAMDVSLAIFFLFISKIILDEILFQSTMQLLTQVIKLAPDIVIWNAVFALVVKPATPPTNSLGKIEPDPPLKSTASS